MYTVGIQRELSARHYLVGRDFGPENRPHPHRYRVEFRLSGERLDADGFLVDIDALAAGIDAVLPRFQNALLNELPEFEGLNPSIEHLARILWRAFRARLTPPDRMAAAVTVWEDAVGWAAFGEPPA